VIKRSGPWSAGSGGPRRSVRVDIGNESENSARRFPCRGDERREEDLRAAFLQSYAGLATDAHRLRAVIVERPAAPVVAEEERAYVI
jgi:hypothetical protein